MFYLDKFIGDESICRYCSWMLILILLFNVKNAFSANKSYGTGYIVLFFVMLIYCVFYSPEDGDNYSTMVSYFSYLNGTDESRLHFESVYFRLMDFFPYGYVVYRSVVWGAACFMGVLLMKKIGIDSHLATLAMLTYALPILLYYQRASFGYILLYVAAAIYCSKGRILYDNIVVKKLYVPIAVLLLICAVPFHTTMPVYILFLLLSLYIPRNYFFIIFVIVIALVLSFNVKTISLFALEYTLEGTIETGRRTLEGDAGLILWNTNGKIYQFLYWFPIWCMLAYTIFKMISKPFSLTEFEKVCLLNSFFLFLVALLFINVSQVVYVKFNNFAMLPWTFFIASYYGRFREQLECRLFAIYTICIFFI